MRWAWLTTALGTLALAASGCTTDAFCFSCTDAHPGQGGGGSTSVGGSGGEGGGFGGEGGDPWISSASTTTADGGPDACSADVETDPKNCGACDHVCELFGAFPKCVEGQCAIDTCATGRVDLNGIDSDGCEYACALTNGGVEACDDVDNDCDGEKDEGFDLTTDTDNCGSCGHVCSLPNTTTVSCSAAQGFPTCIVDACEEGFANLDGVDANGCEYGCPVFPTMSETCNGQDDDCDGVVDQGNPGGGADCSETCPNGVCLGQCTPGTTVCGGAGLVCVPGVGPALEICDGKDNDCDGVTDNGYDVQTDPLNCGSCGHTCSMENAVGGCQAGECVITTCLPGFSNVDKNDANGCEYACPVTPLAVETCNGKDDDCDGIVDNDAVIALQKPATALCYPKPGSPCEGADFACMGALGWRCNYGPDVEVDAKGKLAVIESRCDGKDGNCNGQVDEAFPDLGTSCDNELMGACRDVGLRKCDADKTKTFCDLAVLPDPVPGAPSAEVCNGLDDDCNGLTDDAIEDDMVMVDIGGVKFEMDRYEASRPDATASWAGVVEDRRCVNPNVIPWTYAPFAEAKAACEATGARLCTADEMVAACRGAELNVYPYGMSYEPDTCNGLDFGALGVDALLGTASPSILSCATTLGIHDLSGNAAEWTSTQTGVTPNSLPIYIAKGGSYKTPALGLSCGFDLSRFASNAILPELGFRCCHDAP
jgi:hypothetical protein